MGVWAAAASSAYGARHQTPGTRPHVAGSAAGRGVVGKTAEKADKQTRGTVSCLKMRQVSVQKVPEQRSHAESARARNHSVGCAVGCGVVQATGWSLVAFLVSAQAWRPGGDVATIEHVSAQGSTLAPALKDVPGITPSPCLECEPSERDSDGGGVFRMGFNGCAGNSHQRRRETAVGQKATGLAGSRTGRPDGQGLRHAGRCEFRCQPLHSRAPWLLVCT